MPTPPRYRQPPQPTTIVLQQPTAPVAPVAPVVPVAQTAQMAPVVGGRPPSVLEYVMKHPVAPVAGAVLFMISQLTDEPVPPTIPADLPEPVAKQWQMIYGQNQQRYTRRMGLYEKAGLALLGYTSINTLLDALPKRQ
jgi:hypothetical protein